MAIAMAMAMTMTVATNKDIKIKKYHSMVDKNQSLVFRIRIDIHDKVTGEI